MTEIVIVVIVAGVSYSIQRAYFLRVAARGRCTGHSAETRARRSGPGGDFHGVIATTVTFNRPSRPVLRSKWDRRSAAGPATDQRASAVFGGGIAGKHPI